jgi:acetyltransferase-like isoleucine patch superfamily enzyme
MGLLSLQLWLRRKKAQIYTQLVKSDFGAIGKGSLIVCPFLSFNPKSIYLGENVGIFQNCWLDCVKEYAGKEYHPRLEIGDRTSVGSNAHIIACSRISIGKDVVIAQRVYITDNLHGYDEISTAITYQPLVHPGPVEIEDQVWLGEGVCVLPNITIGKHSVIGSNAVVTKSIPPYSVAIGVPAKVIKQFNQKTNSWERI